MPHPKFCQVCATPLEWIALMEDGGPKERLRCPNCGHTHWNNPTPVLAAIVEYRGQVLLARNAAWPGKMFALITGFMEAGETPEEGIAREVKLSPELVDYRLYDLPDLKCWPAGTGYALADWLRTRGHEPVFFTAAENEERRRGLNLPPEPGNAS